MRQAADEAHGLLQRLDDPAARLRRRRAWLDAAVVVQDAVTRHAKAKRLNRYEVEAGVRRVVRRPGMSEGCGPR